MKKYNPRTAPAIKPASDLSVTHTQKVEFVGFGEFNKEMLLWRSPKEGYFTTGPTGLSMNGEYRLQQTTVEALAYASK